MNKFFVSMFKTSISFEDYESPQYDELHTYLLWSDWVKNIGQFFLETNLSNDATFSSSKELTYLIFQTLSNSQELYIYKPTTTKELGEKFFVFDLENVAKYMNSSEYWDGTISLSNYLIEFKKNLESKNEFKVAFEKYIDSRQKAEDFEKFFQDIKGIPFIAEEFLNSSIQLLIKDWKPYYMEAETYSKNTDFGYRKKKIWPYRKIEENTNDGKVVGVKIVKKVKYE